MMISLASKARFRLPTVTWDSAPAAPWSLLGAGHHALQVGREVGSGGSADLAGDGVQGGEVLGGELDAHRPGVFLHARGAFRAGDRDGGGAVCPRLVDQPGEGDLPGGGIVVVGDLLDGLEQADVVRGALARKRGIAWRKSSGASPSVEV